MSKDFEKEHWTSFKPKESNGYWKVVETTGRCEFEVSTCYREDAEEIANFIAAAPDLYRACLQAKQIYEEVGIGKSSNIYRQLKNAIEKATE